MKVEILLATYNGEKFLPILLNSLLAQTYSDWVVLARDDGSTDSTYRILEDFKRCNPNRMVIVSSENIENVNNMSNIRGASKNFSYLMEMSTAPIIMFCDQDDIWYESKIEVSVKRIIEVGKKYGFNKPALVHSDYSIIDQDGKMLIESYNETRKRKKGKITFEGMLIQNKVSGFTLCVNRELLVNCIPIPFDIVMYDAWIGKVCLLINGKVSFINFPLAGYRQHQNNVIGVFLNSRKLTHRVKSICNEGLCNALKRIYFDKKNKIEAELSANIKISKELLTRYPANLTGDRAVILEIFSSIAESSYFMKILIIIRYKFFPSSIVKLIYTLLIPLELNKD